MAGSSIALHLRIPVTRASSDFEWTEAAIVPLEELRHFSAFPYRWLCYVSYCVTGVQGQLSLSAARMTLVDYDASNIPENVASVYYHYPEGFAREMCLIDLQSTSSTSYDTTSSERDPDFSCSVVDRDQRDVVMGFADWISDAAHLISLNKGDEFIQRLTTMRSVEGGRDIIMDIDSVRNGLLVNPLVHNLMGRDIAFLPTPNFILDTSHLHVNGSTQEPACTLHVFSPRKRISRGVIVNAQHGSQLRLPTSESSREHWPPPTLFHYVYGEVFMKNFRSSTLIARCRDWEQTNPDKEVKHLKRSPEGQKLDGRCMDKIRNSDENPDLHFTLWTILGLYRSTTGAHALLEVEKKEMVADWVRNQLVY